MLMDMIIKKKSEFIKMKKLEEKILIYLGIESPYLA